jgi:3-hydroxyisobutyrate dehydrogenase-like beta-hydroxyacid dehydrogenase
MEQTTRIGFVGLGHMGGNMAARFLPRATPSTARSGPESTRKTLCTRGCSGATRRVRSARPPKFSSPPSPTTMSSKASRPDPTEFSPAAAPKIWVDVSTVSPHVSRELAERVGALGATMLDAPVSGSVPQVQAGTLTIMVGGDERAYAHVEPLLRELGTPTYIGANGQGLLLKLAINISLAVQMLAFSEGLLLAERGGVDRELAVKVMGSSPIGSPMLKARAPLILDLPDEAWFDVELMQKDIRLALATGQREHVPLPSAAVADELLTRASKLGHGHHDIAALYDVFAQTAAEQGASCSDEQTQQ